MLSVGVDIIEIERVGQMVTIPMSSPDLTDAEIAAVTQVLQTPFLSIGPQFTAFERVSAFM